MRRIFTFPFIAIALLLASFNSFGQCTLTTENFTSASDTRGFIGTKTSGSGTFTSLAAASNQLRTTVTANGTNTYMITSPTYSTPALLAPISFTFTFNHGAQATLLNVQYAIRYMNTSNAIVQTIPADYFNTNSTCTTIPRPSDMSGNKYQVVAIYTVTSGNGNSANGYISFDNFGTNGTFAQASLPVKFSSLDAIAANNSVSLKWNVATEENVNGYEIERSADGRNYSKIGFVSADGQSSYSFVDSKAISIAYYRIKSVDKDGKYGYSTIAMVKAGKSAIVLKAFPTPFIKNVSIQHPSAVAGSSITVSAEDGRIVKSIIPAVGIQQTDIDLSSAKAGLYLVRYVSGNGEVETLKVLKQQ